MSFYDETLKARHEDDRTMNTAKPAVMVAAQPKRITTKKKKNPSAPKAAAALRSQRAAKLQPQ